MQIMIIFHHGEGFNEDFKIHDVAYHILLKEHYFFVKDDTVLNAHFSVILYIVQCEVHKFQGTSGFYFMHTEINVASVFSGCF